MQLLHIARSSPPCFSRRLAVLDLNQTRLESLEVGAVPIINSFLQRLQLREIIDRHLPPPPLRPGRAPALSPATIVLVLLRNILLSRSGPRGPGNTPFVVVKAPPFPDPQISLKGGKPQRQSRFPWFCPNGATAPCRGSPCTPFPNGCKGSFQDCLTSPPPRFGFFMMIVLAGHSIGCFAARNPRS